VPSTAWAATPTAVLSMPALRQGRQPEGRHRALPQDKRQESDPGERALEFRRSWAGSSDVCNAIGYAHSRGVLHRDLKPGNILLGPYAKTLVVDWAWPRSSADRGTRVLGRSHLRPEAASGSAPTIAGSAIGTPQFMSQSKPPASSTN